MYHCIFEYMCYTFLFSLLCYLNIRAVSYISVSLASLQSARYWDVWMIKGIQNRLLLPSWRKDFLVKPYILSSIYPSNKQCLSSRKRYRMFVLKLQHFISGFLLHHFLSSYLTSSVSLSLFLSLSLFHTHIHTHLPFFKKKNILMVLFIYFWYMIWYKIRMLCNSKKFAF